MAACEAELRVEPHDLARAGWHYIVAADGEALLGYYAIAPLDAARVELEALFVEPEAIGTGIGRMLFIDAGRRAQADGATKMIIQADPYARRFYEDGGARLLGERASESIAGRMLPVLELDLAMAAAAQREAH